MSFIQEMTEQFYNSCNEFNIQPHPYVLKMFDKEKEERSADAKDSMYLYLSGSNKLLTDLRISDPDVQALTSTLAKKHYVTTLDLRYNLITDEGAMHLAKLIQETTVLAHLNLMGNEIGQDGAGYLAEALMNNKTLLSLRMTGNKIGNKGGMHFAQALQVNGTLEDLDLGDTDMTIESIIAMATVLHTNTTLKALNVNRPILFTHQEETTVHFSKMLKVNETLLELHLQKYDMSEFGATRLADCLVQNFTLTYLDLSCNRITRDGTKELAKVLKANTMLKTLDLGANRIEDDGAMHLADALGMFNTHLQTLVIVNNNIHGMGLCALAECLKINTTLTNLYIWGNKLEESACIAFAELVGWGRLELENIDVKPYVVDGITNLCELTHHIRRHYYWAPSYGDDVPSWQPKGENVQRAREKVKILK